MTLSKWRHTHVFFFHFIFLKVTHWAFKYVCGTAAQLGSANFPRNTRRQQNSFRGYVREMKKYGKVLTNEAGLVELCKQMPLWFWGAVVLQSVRMMKNAETICFDYALCRRWSYRCQNSTLVSFHCDFPWWEACVCVCVHTSVNTGAENNPKNGPTPIPSPIWICIIPKTPIRICSHKLCSPDPLPAPQCHFFFLHRTRLTMHI